MQHTTYELMHDQVRAIYRALTGADLSEGGPAPRSSGPVTAEMVAQRFAELETIARTIPEVAAHVPPFAFSPPIDVIDSEGELLVEVAVPGVDKKDVHVNLTGDMLVISGMRTGEKAANGRVFRHAEIPRGPFRRVVLLPYPSMGEPRVEVDQGVVRIHLPKLPKGTAARA